MFRKKSGFAWGEPEYAAKPIKETKTRRRQVRFDPYQTSSKSTWGWDPSAVAPQKKETAATQPNTATLKQIEKAAVENDVKLVTEGVFKEMGLRVPHRRTSASMLAKEAAIQAKIDKRMAKKAAKRPMHRPPHLSNLLRMNCKSWKCILTVTETSTNHAKNKLAFLSNTKPNVLQPKL